MLSYISAELIGNTWMSRSLDVKLVLLGDMSVGKTSIVNMFVTNEFTPYVESTIGAAFTMKVLNVNGRVIKYSIWDTSGQEKYYSLAPMYYRNAAAALLVYDITAASSFKKLEYWVSELRSNGPENVVMLVVGNKADLSARRTVPLAEAKAFAQSIGADYFETSAKEGSNVTKVFLRLATQLEAAAPAAAAQENQDVLHMGQQHMHPSTAGNPRPQRRPGGGAGAGGSGSCC